jgi:hypothetical protein
MSFVRLLTSGKALTTLRDLPSAYRLRRDGWLPKFGVGRDPFASKEPTRVAEAPAVSPAVAEGETKARKSIWPWRGRETSDRNTSSLRLASIVLRPGSKEARMPVQSELSLDAVKVIRNDLHGSDVDLVSTAKSPENAYQQVASNLLSGANAAEQALDRLAARIVGTDAH